MWMTSIGATCIILFMYLVVSRTMLISSSFSILHSFPSFIVSGYLKFGVDTAGNILNNYPSDALLPTVARVGLGLGIICHFPIAYFAVRTNLHSLFCQLKEFHSLGLRFVYVQLEFMELG